MLSAIPFAPALCNAVFAATYETAAKNALKNQAARIWQQPSLTAGLPHLTFCHPQNPTGRAYSRGELEAVTAFAIRHDLVVVSDEIHAEVRGVG